MRYGMVLLDRRTLLGSLVAAVLLPVSGLKWLAGHSKSGWRTLHEKIGPWDCAVRYRWRSDRDIDVDWYSMSASRDEVPDGGLRLGIVFDPADRHVWFDLEASAL